MDSLIIQERRVRVAGKRLAVRRIAHSRTGNHRDTPVLVFLHEGLGCMAFWKNFPEKLCLATGLDALLYDRQGYGASDPMDLPRTREYHFIEAHEYLPELLDALDIEKTVPIGHSDGGTIALLFAGRYPAKVRCLVTEAAHVYVDDMALAGIQKAVDAYRNGSLQKTLEKYHGAKTDDVFWSWADTWLADWFATWNIEADLAGVVAPTLVIQGKTDPYGRIDQVDRIVRRTFGPAESVLVDSCGHSPHTETPDIVLAEIRRFLDKYL